MASDVESAETLAAENRTSATPPPVRAGRRPTLLPPGTQVGRYLLAERLGSGGMGVVYRARDPRLDRDVALKLVNVTFDVDAAQVRLEREAQAMAKLQNANVVAIHDIGTHEGQLFIAMELCESSLGAWLRTHRPWREVLAKFISAGRGLAAAHAIGLVHRDFKPDNVLVAHDGTVKVTDFGLVVSMSDAEGGQRIEGTPSYMAPEQLAGDDVDARADQFAFAVSVWEGVCGGRPFQPISTEDAMSGMLHQIRARIRMRATSSTVPMRVIRVLERALEPEPADRWPSLDAMLLALERTMRSRRRTYAVAAAILGAAATSALVAVLLRHDKPDIDRDGGRILTALPKLYEIAGYATEDPTEAASLLMTAYHLGGTPELLYRAALLHYTAGECGRAFDALHVMKGVAFDRLSFTDTAKQQLDEVVTDCRLPADLETLEHAADRYLATEEYHRQRALMYRARKISTDPGQRAIYMLRIADGANAQGECGIARKAYEQYLREERRGGPEMDASIRQRAADCKTSAD